MVDFDRWGLKQSLASGRLSATLAGAR